MMTLGVVLISTIYVQRKASKINDTADRSTTKLLAFFGTLSLLLVLAIFILDSVSLITINDQKVITVVFGTIWFSTFLMIILPLYIIFKNENMFNFVKNHLYHTSNSIYPIVE